jgi:hypothetical protein
MNVDSTLSLINFIICWIVYFLPTNNPNQEVQNVLLICASIWSFTLLIHLGLYLYDNHFKLTK